MFMLLSFCIYFLPLYQDAIAQEAPAAELARRERVYAPTSLPFMLQENLFPWYAAELFKKVPGFYKGSFAYKNYTHFDDTPKDKRRVRNEYLLELQYELNFADRFRLFTIPQFYFDDDHFGRGVVNEPVDDDLRRNIFDVQELYLDVYFDDFDLRLGKQVFAWGKADELNPTDNLGAEDLQDLFDDRDLGVLAARLNYYFGDYQIEAALVPYFTPTRLPTRNNRFSFIPPVTPMPVQNPLLPSKTLSNIQWGIRLLRTIGAWDLSVSYYDGIYHIPVVRFVPSAGIQPIYEGVRVLGGDMATQFGKLGLRGEVGYFLFDGDLDDDFVQYVLGLDYTFSDVIGDDDIYFLIQYVGEGVTNDGDLVIPELSTSVGRAFSSSFTMDLSYEFSEFLKMALDLIYLTDSRDSFLFRPKLEYEYSDRLSLILSFDIPQGDKETFFGRFRDSKRLYFEMNYGF
jgi:hypothetical protein